MAQRIVFVAGLIFLAIWAILIFTGWTSYFASAPESEGQTPMEWLKNWPATEVDTSTSKATLPDLERQLRSAVDSARQSMNLPGLRDDPVQSALCRSIARDMLERGYNQLITPEGITVDEQIARWQRKELGKHGAVPGPFPAPGATADWTKDVVRSWVNSTDQLSTILNPDARSLGLGIYSSGGRYLAVAIFTDPVMEFVQPLPMKQPASSTLDMEGTLVGHWISRPPQFEWIRQHHGFWKAHDVSVTPVKLTPTGGKVRLQLKFDGSGLYMLVIRDSDGDVLDFRPIKVD